VASQWLRESLSKGQPFTVPGVVWLGFLRLVTDAYIATSAVTLRAGVVTFDRDFRTFDGVRILEPS
jgi:predicted nucleic acid-binding protein